MKLVSEKPVTLLEVNDLLRKRHKESTGEFPYEQQNTLDYSEKFVDTLTPAKAKELKKVADKMISLGKRGDLHARRQAAAYVRERDMVGKLFGEISERFKERAGGYTRIVKSGYRAGDNAPMDIIEFGQKAYTEKPKKKTLKPKK